MCTTCASDAAYACAELRYNIANKLPYIRYFDRRVQFILSIFTCPYLIMKELLWLYTMQ